jgi:glycosyltransferase involved in cell wall biosynthesis
VTETSEGMPTSSQFACSGNVHVFTQTDIDQRKNPIPTVRDDAAATKEGGSRVSVSVVIPAYNASGCIGATLDSVLAQTFSDYEIIVVNDGSPDTEALEQVLQRYLLYIRYFKQENRGPSSSRNRGIVEARGEYVAFLDADDFWLPQHLASQITILRNTPSLGLVYSDSLVVRDGKCIRKTFDRERQEKPVTFEALLGERCTVSTSTTVASRKELLGAGLFDEGMTRCEDFDLWLRMAFRGTSMTYSPEVHVCRMVSRSGLSSDRYQIKRARIDVYRKMDSSLPLSQTQKELLRRRCERTEAGAQLDLVKESIHAGDFETALACANRASSLLDSWRVRLAVIALAQAPRCFGAYYRAHEQVLSMCNRIQAAWSERKFRMFQPMLRPPVSLTPSSAGLQQSSSLSQPVRGPVNGH